MRTKPFSIPTLCLLGFSVLLGASSKTYAQTPAALYSLDSSQSAATGTKGQKTASTVVNKSSLASLKQHTVGETVQLPIKGQAPIQGTIKMARQQKGQYQVAGSLSTGKGSFALITSGKDIEGSIELPESGTGYVFKSNVNGQVTLTQKKLEDIICFPLPRDTKTSTRRTLSNRVLASIPVLNSRPDAVAQIYLDFDGEVVTDPYWTDGGTIDAPAYDLTVADITTIFNRVKEDYWPFDVNITTSLAKYNAAPASQRIQCVVTSNDAAAPGSGGVARIGGFGEGHVCWVFNSTTTGIAEAASHEVGHTLGLRHDGTSSLTYYYGHANPNGGGWAAIMGASYYQPTTQWSKGEYSDASNIEDDLAIITSTLPYRPDEGGDTRAAAIPITYQSAGSPKVVGIIHAATDVDYYAFSTTGGAVTFNAVGADPSPNLDIRLQIENGSGTVVATANPLDTLSASLTATLAAGTYYLKVQGAGVPAPPATGYTTYASIGAYTITGTIPGGAKGSTQATLLAPLDSASVTGTYNLRAKTTGTATVKSVQFGYRMLPSTVTKSPNLAIPDSSTVTDSINSTNSAPASTVTVKITHPYIGDLVLTLISPDGTRSVLRDRTGGNTANLLETYDVSAAFLNKNSVGAWTLEVSDTSGGDVGVLNSWSLTFQSSTWTTIATDADGVNSSGEWTGTWDTSHVLTGKYEVRALPIVGAADAAVADTNTNITVTGYTPPSLKISDATVTEGNTDSKLATFTVSLSAPTFQTVTVRCRSIASPAPAATMNSDYTALPATTLTFTPGQTSKTVSVTVKADLLDEDDEKFALQLDSVTNATLADDIGIGTILDDDATPSLSVTSPSVVEGNGGGISNLVFLVKLSAASGRTVTAKYQTVASSTLPATVATDYNALPLTTLTFAPGETTKAVNVEVIGDDLDEDDERIGLQLSAVTNATPSTATAVGIIKDDDATPSLSSGDYLYVQEANAGTNPVVTFTIYLSAPSGRAVSVKYATVAKTATANTDYVSIAATTLTFAPGETSKTVNATVKGDALDENDEVFALLLSTPINATISTNTAQCTIQDDDNTPSLSIASVAVTEGNSTPAVLPFTVKLSAPSGLPITVKYATSDDTATAKLDYTPIALKPILFAPGETSKVINVSVIPDTQDEINEKFYLNFSEPVNAGLTNYSAIGTIVDDDTAPSISVADVRMTEGNDNSRYAQFIVKLSAKSGLPITLNTKTANGLTQSATANVDYAGQGLTPLRFEPGQITQIVNVPIYGDTLDELDETFQLVLSNPVNATIADNAGVATLVDDDLPPKITISDSSVYEGNSDAVKISFTVNLSAASGLPVTVKYNTADGTATASNDYVSVAATTLTFAPGETSKTIYVALKPDTRDEADEQFTVVLSAPTNATIADASAVGLIYNDDSAPSLSATGSSIKEGVEGTVLTYTLTLSAASGKSIKVTAQTLNDGNSSATANIDYTPLPLTAVTFAPGETRKSVTVAIKPDLLDEANETVALQLSDIVNASLNVSTVWGTILDDDLPPTLSVDSISVNEGSAGQQSEAIFTVRLSAPSGLDISVNYQTLTGTTNPAESWSDFGPISGTLSFAPGETVKTVSVPIYGDDVPEANEIFSLYLSGSVSATIATSRGTGTIMDDDSSATSAIQSEQPAFSGERS